MWLSAARAGTILRLGYCYTCFATCLALALLATAPDARAHSRLLESRPSDGAILDAAPDRLILNFSTPLEPGFSKIELASINAWQPLRILQQGAHLEAALPSLGPGLHKIRWSVLSRDGHRQYGIITFRVR